MGLSTTFLLSWCFADSAALAGCLLTAQESTMVLCLAYFCLSDVVMLLQYATYHSLARPPVDAANPLLASSGPRTVNVRRACVMLCIFAASVVAIILALVQMPRAASPLCDAPLLGALLDTPWARPAGAALSWAANCAYVGARVPQIATNYRRQSVEVRAAVKVIITATTTIKSF